MHYGGGNRILNLITVCVIKSHKFTTVRCFLFCRLAAQVIQYSSGSVNSYIKRKFVIISMFLFRGNSCLNNTIRSVGRHHIRSMSVTNKPILYGDIASPPVRFTMMTASVLKVDLEFYNVNIFNAENKTEFYKKINPLQKVPALSVNGDVICDSNAIALYLCRITKDQELYPKDKLLRAKIDDMMYFNSSVLFPIDSAVFVDFFAGKWPVDEVKLNKWYSSLDYLDFKLSKQKWLTGDEIRLCDICCGTTLSSLETLIPFLERHGNVKEWLNNLKALPCFEINDRGLKRLQSFVKIVKPQ